MKNKPEVDRVPQLLALKSWSKNPEAYYKKLADKKLIKWALEESPEPIVKNPVMKKAISEPRAITRPKAVKVAGIKDTALYRTLKDPRVIGLNLGNDTIMEVINLIQNSGLVKKPEPKPTIPIEEKINQIAYQRKLAENKLFGLNEEFAKQKLREQMS